MTIYKYVYSSFVVNGLEENTLWYHEHTWHPDTFNFNTFPRKETKFPEENGHFQGRKGTR
jgi:hypothetical protein